MAILVLGGAGYIGSHMVDRLVEKGQEKVVVVMKQDLLKNIITLM